MDDGWALVIMGLCCMAFGLFMGLFVLSLCTVAKRADEACEEAARGRRLQKAWLILRGSLHVEDHSPDTAMIYTTVGAVRKADDAARGTADRSIHPQP